jgi:hypothetical protein
MLNEIGTAPRKARTVGCSSPLALDVDLGRSLISSRRLHSAMHNVEPECQLLGPDVTKIVIGRIVSIW